MHVVTFATQDIGALRYLKQSFEKFRSVHDRFTVLGANQDWYSAAARLRQYRAYIASLGAADRDAVCLFLDGYDTLLTGSLEELEARFVRRSQENRQHILLSVEMLGQTQRWLNTVLCRPEVQSSNVCAGVYMGRASALAQMMDELLMDAEVRGGRFWDESRSFGEWVVQNPTKVMLDVNGDLFVTWAVNHQSYDAAHEITLRSDGTLRFGGRPAYVLHRPFAHNMTDTVRSLGYYVSPADRKVLERKSQYFCSVLSIYTFNVIRNHIASLGAFMISCVIIMVLITLFITLSYTRRSPQALKTRE